MKVKKMENLERESNSDRYSLKKNQKKKKLECVLDDDYYIYSLILIS